MSPVNRILATGLFRINGLLLLIGSVGIAYLRLHESGSPIKLFLHSLTFVAFGTFFAATPRLVIRRFGFVYALSLRVVALLAGVGVLLLVTNRESEASHFSSSGVWPVIVLVSCLLLSVVELIYTQGRLTLGTDADSHETPTP